MRGGLLADVYDGNLWREFQTVNGTPFLQKPQNYGFMLNFNFFSTHETPQRLLRWSVLFSRFKFA